MGMEDKHSETTDRSRCTTCGGLRGPGWREKLAVFVGWQEEEAALVDCLKQHSTALLTAAVAILPRLQVRPVG